MVSSAQDTPDGAAAPDDTAAGDALIRLRGVRKEYPNGTVAVSDLDLDVHRHELLALVGPSGCGKSTTLRMVNRLVEPTSGRIWLDGQDVTAVDPVRLRRGVGYVIQNVGLFPHRTVAQNVATVPRLLGWDRARGRARVTELLDLVGLPPDTYGRRYPHELSGGQRQRVGVARALATDPPVLLMDEPFGAVDPEGRRRLQREFRRIHRELGTTVMLVTHDIDEAVTLGDRVAVFGQGGVIEQLADPVTLLARPANEFVESFIGSGRTVRLLSVGRVEESDLVPVHSDPSTSRAVGAGAAGDAAAQIPLGASLEEALTALATAPGDGVPVVEGGATRGRLTASGLVGALHRLATHDAA
ncbi:MAG: ABC transporter ATP-binding protein [Cellulomonadaceae bacterium]